MGDGEGWERRGRALKRLCLCSARPPSRFPRGEIQLSLQTELQSCPVFLNPSVACRSFLRSSGTLQHLSGGFMLGFSLLPCFRLFIYTSETLYYIKRRLNAGTVP